MNFFPVALKGLEILLEMTFSIDVGKIKILERLKSYIETHYTIENTEPTKSNLNLELDRDEN